jgi:hypothetical protein
MRLTKKNVRDSKKITRSLCVKLPIIHVLGIKFCLLAAHSPSSLRRLWQIRMRPESAVSIVTTTWTGRKAKEQLFISQHEQDTIFRASRLNLATTQPPIPWLTKCSFPGDKWPEPEADQSYPSSAEVNNTWRYISTSPQAFLTDTRKFRFTFRSLQGTSNNYGICNISCHMHLK